MKITLEILFDIPLKMDASGAWDDILNAETQEEVNEVNKRFVDTIAKALKQYNWADILQEYEGAAYERTKYGRMAISFPAKSAEIRITKDDKFSDLTAIDAFNTLKRKGWL